MPHFALSFFVFFLFEFLECLTEFGGEGRGGPGASPPLCRQAFCPLCFLDEGGGGNRASAGRGKDQGSLFSRVSSSSPVQSVKRPRPKLVFFPRPTSAPKER